MNALAIAALALQAPAPAQWSFADRGVASEHLASVLSATAELSGEGTLQMFLDAGGRALAQLRDSRLAPRLEEALDMAQDPSRTAEDSLSLLRREFEALVTILTFEPLIEAPLPADFPRPTPLGEIALKSYPLYRKVETGASASGRAFWKLFGHIEKHDIPMTAPVESTYSESRREVSMAFLYESASTGRTGADGAVRVVDSEPSLAVSMGCRGYSTESSVAQAAEALEAWIADRDDLRVDGPLRVMSYNSPAVPAARRFFEVEFPVKRTPARELEK